MTKWQVEVIERRRHTVIVEADSWTDADTAATNKVEDGHSSATRVDYDTRNHVQLGEPWAHSCGWYDLHGPGDVVVVDRSHGNFFTGNDIAILRARLADIGLPAVEHWNGEGCGTVSFRCRGRTSDAAFTKEQLDTLLAPRPT